MLSFPMCPTDSMPNLGILLYENYFTDNVFICCCIKATFNGLNPQEIETGSKITIQVL